MSTPRELTVHRNVVDGVALRATAPYFIVVAASLAYLLALALPPGDDGARRLGATGAVLCALSLYTFLRSGGKIIVSSSVLSYSILMFLGFPAIYSALGLYSSQRNYSPDSLIITVSLGFLLQVLVYLATPKSGSDAAGRHHSREPVSPETVVAMTRWCLLLAVGLFVAFLVARQVGMPVATSAFSWAAVVFAAAAAFDLSVRKVRPVGLVLLVVILVIAYGSDIGGFGRLNLAVVSLSVAVIASMALRTWWIKIAIGVLTAPALIYLVNQRLEYLQEERGGTVDSDEGIGSVVGPFHSAATIVEALQDGHIDLSWGATVLTAALAWVPRAIWPEKPAGFGREIVEITQPGLVSSIEHSDAGTIIGEGVWNFGVWGAALLLIPVALSARFLDRKLLARAAGPRSMRELVEVLVLAVFAGGWLNAVWGGAFTFTSRLMLPVALLLMIQLLVAGRIKPEPTAPAPVDPKPTHSTRGARTRGRAPTPRR